jgi:hypothetical protein
MTAGRFSDFPGKEKRKIAAGILLFAAIFG